jgi:hypothetical protein
MQYNILFRNKKSVYISLFLFFDIQILITPLLSSNSSYKFVKLREKVATGNNQMISNIYTVVNDIFKLGIQLIYRTQVLRKGKQFLLH